MNRQENLTNRWMVRKAKKKKKKNQPAHKAKTTHGNSNCILTIDSSSISLELSNTCKRNAFIVKRTEKLPAVWLIINLRIIVGTESRWIWAEPLLKTVSIELLFLNWMLEKEEKKQKKNEMLKRESKKRIHWKTLKNFKQFFFLFSFQTYRTILELYLQLCSLQMKMMALKQRNRQFKIFWKRFTSFERWKNKEQ